ncbi:IS110 family transposase [Alicyclobacillus sp. SO9]|nr:IS110 family transposase [Alicyclobacillus sp. SO9]
MYISVNPLIAHQAKTSSLRKVKTDALDAYRLCELYYKEELEPLKKRGEKLLNLRNVSRQHDAITKLLVQTKLQFQALLDQIFPEYVGVFGELYSFVSMQTLLDFPTAESVSATSKTDLADQIATRCPSPSKRWARERAEQLTMAASRNPFRSALVQSHLFSLEMYIKIILQYKGHLSQLKRQIDALAQDIEEYQIIQSIPGIGQKIAATIISEIGEIDQLNHPRKLVAFAGVDPSVHSATSNRISKRGSSRLRHALYEGVSCGLRKTGCNKLKAYYDKKKDKGKPYKVIVVACVNKLIHWIYALLTNKELFLDMA